MLRYATAALVTLALTLAPIVVEVEWKSARAATLPWTTFSESVRDTVNAMPGACRQGEILVAMLTHDGANYMYWYAPETGRVVFATFGADGQVSEVGAGTVDLKNMDQIPPLAWVKADLMGVHAGGPCAALYPDKA